ncbi:MAG: class I SAM-dependent methyltransferase, partial [Lachnospiraceae bacterium]|nr:class I SAM-dependent methyltransferase [Lachnospiraceae bacterium]
MELKDGGMNGMMRKLQMNQEEEMEKRVQNYWTIRTKDFHAIRLNELRGEISNRWLSELKEKLPKDRPLEILDAGTGTGYFSILLAKEGHRVTGIDLTPSMLEEARNTASLFGVNASFLEMNVQETTFERDCFDAIVTRNVTWTLPDPEKAYREWHRILKPGGILLNFDANYADNVRHQNQKESWIRPDGVYGHIGMTPELMMENARITLSVPASEHHRPQWDAQIAERIGFSSWGADEGLGK